VTRPHVFPGQARLDRCRDELQFWRNYACLLPYAVKVDRAPVARIPAPRRPADPWPRPTPQGLPPASRIGLPRRPR
jgi:hypothetical protein